MKTNQYVWSCVAHFFLEWEMLLTKTEQKIKTRILFSIIFFLKIIPFWDNVEKYSTAGQATDDNMAHEHCILDT
jgi:hypothetical protein